MDWLRILGSIVARMLLRVAMDRQLREAVYDAVRIAEHSGLSGEAKMQEALAHIKKTAGDALVRETTSTLRTKVEQVIDDLYPQEY